MYRPDQPEQRPRPPFGPSSPCVPHFTPRGPCPLPHLGHMPPRPSEPFSENLFRFSGPPRGPFVRSLQPTVWMTANPRAPNKESEP
ncbi:hypothetical protein CHARACLAT_013195 [Characodon lateralis]|uniref:Uncharacterized protein n=1 Tax=Characodon lateralis TaxID=208331 RepID=A0ABU7E057_9TELE|nr:hypothetical protein [Characodon lateralis]